MMLLIAVAFIAGLVTVLSPCILPILPVVLASSTGGRRRPLALVAGLVVSFAAFTLVISQIVMRLGLSAGLLRLAAVILLGFLGLALVVPTLGAHLERWLSRLPGLAPQGGSDAGWRGGLLTGATLGLLWAPCAGPILAAVTTLAATQRANLASVAVAFAYAIGVGVPLLIIAYGGQAVIRRVPFFARHTLTIQKAFGVMMMATAALIALNLDVTLSASAASLLPDDWSRRLSAIETSPQVTGELQALSGQTPASRPTPGDVSLRNYGMAPELAGIGTWLNSGPLTLAGLRGKVVMIDFWTYSCINCIRTLPYVTQWYSTYKDQGFVIIGVHSPEFAFERDTDNVVQAMKRFGITYPVAQDNSFSTWQAYNNLYWPAKYIIDANGDLRYTHFGEGAYDETERVIQALLAEAGKTVQEQAIQPVRVPIAAGQTPETYLGLARPGRFASPQPPILDRAGTFSLPESLPLHAFAVGGQWMFGLESAQALQPEATLAIHFRGKDVYLVMTSDQPVPLTVALDGGQANHSEELNAQGELKVSASRLYHLASLDASADATLTLTFHRPGVKVYAFTFGS